MKKKDEKKGEDDETAELHPTCFQALGNDGNEFIQQVNGGKFVLWKKGDFSYINCIERDKFYVPLKGEEVEKRYILLADAVGNLKPIAKIAKEIADWSKQYVWFKEQNFYLMCAYWAISTWVFDTTSQTAYIRFLGDTASGKSRALDVFGRLAYNYIPASGATSVSPLFRLIEKWRGTVGFDESDIQNSDETNELIKVINLGFEKGRFIMRCNRDKQNEVEFFDPYGPKIFAARHSFQDAATESRCITTTMEEPPTEDYPPVLPKNFLKEAQQFRNDLLAIRLNFLMLKAEPKEFSFPFKCEYRLKQLSVPLLESVLYEEEDRKSYFRMLKRYQNELIEIRSQTLPGQIIHAITEGGFPTEDYVTAKCIADKLDCSTQRISKELRPLGFWSRQQHFGDHNVRALHTTETAWGKNVKRYIPLDEQKEVLLIKQPKWLKFSSRSSEEEEKEHVSAISATTATAATKAVVFGSANLGGFDLGPKKPADAVAATSATKSNITVVADVAQVAAAQQRDALDIITPEKPQNVADVAQVAELQALAAIPAFVVSMEGSKMVEAGPFEVGETFRVPKRIAELLIKTGKARLQQG